MFRTFALLALAARARASSFTEEGLAVLSAPQRALFSRIEAGEVSKSELEIVLVACHDDISWLRPEYAPLSTVMRRCDDPAANRGRESGAYLEHIVANYDDGLAEWTVFSQAHEPTPGYQDGETSHAKEGGHLLRGSSFDDYVLAAANADAAPFYQPVSSMVNISDPSNYRHNVRGSFLPERNGTVARRDEWGAVACPDPARGARARALRAAAGARDGSEEDGFLGWIDLRVDDTQFPRLRAALEHAARTGRAANTAGEYFRAHVCGASSSCPSVLLFGQGARFAVRRSAVLAKPKAYYEALLAEVAWSVDPYQSFYNEWMWSYIVSDGPPPACAGAERAAYPDLEVDGSESLRRMLSGTSSGNTIESSGARAPLPAWPLVVIASVFYQRFLV